MKYEKIVNEIFKVKIGSSPEFMNDIFGFIKTLLPAKKFAIQSRGSKQQTMA